MHAWALELNKAVTKKMQLHGLFPGENDISIQSLKSIKLGGSVKKNSWLQRGTVFPNAITQAQ